MKRHLRHVFQEIISLENLLAAWQQFIRGKRNKIDVQYWQRNLWDNLLSLHEDLTQHRYRHGGYIAFKIADPKPRQIHKGSVRDRVLHHAIYRVLYPEFDRTFIYDSYSCREGKGTHAALEHFNILARRATNNHRRTCWVLQCDIKKFFASIDQLILQHILEQYISDQELLWLLHEVIRSFSSGQVGKGLPLGNLTSQLLVNIYMNEFDQYMKHCLKAKYYLRYADDFVILSPEQDFLESLLPRVEEFLSSVLLLSLHPNKIRITTVARGVDWLGWVHFPDHRVLRTRTKRRMLKRIQESPTQVTVQSYLGMMSHGQAYQLTRKVLNDYYFFHV